MTRVHFRRGRALFTQGETGDQLYVLTAGQVRISQQNHDGRRTLLMIAGPTDVIGALSLFDPGPRTTTADAVTDAMDHDQRPDLHRRPGPSRSNPHVSPAAHGDALQTEY